MAPVKAPKVLAKQSAATAAAADAEDDVMEEVLDLDAEDEDGDSAGVDDDLEGAAAELDLEDASEFETDEDEEEEEEEDGGAPVSPSAIPMIGTTAASTASVPSMSLDAASNEASTSLNPTKPTPYVYDAGHMLVVDPNPIPMASSEQKPSEQVLTSTARDAAQSLLNHMLTTCPITSSKGATSGSGVLMTLPPPNFALPREKPVPVPKPPTKWEQFAAKKGIGKNKRRNLDGENRAGKMVYDEASGEWVPRYGYKGKNKAGEKEWLVEIDTKEEKKQAEQGQAGRDPRTASRAERMERMKRNDRRMRANERKASKGKK